MRDDPSVLTGTTGDEASATGRPIGRRMAVELLDVHHAAYSVSLAIPRLGDHVANGRSRQIADASVS
jgi:hypothetical protein